MALLGALFLCLLSVYPSLASATQFGSVGEGAGQLASAVGIAIDNGNPLESPSVGDVYIADEANDRIAKFSSEGEFLLAWGAGVVDGEETPEVCGPDATPPSASCQAGKVSAAAGALSFPSGVAVDIASDLSHGDVYVEDSGNNRIEKFSEDGQFLLAWGWGVADGKEESETCGPQAAVPTSVCLAGLEGTQGGEFSELASNTITVDSTGIVTVGDGTRLERFSERGNFEGEVPLVGSANEVDALVESSSKDFYAVRGEFRVPAGLRVYDKTGAELSTLDAEAGPGSYVAVGPSGEVFDDTGGRISEFDSGGVELANFSSPSATGLATEGQSGELYVLLGSVVDVLTPPRPGPIVESTSASPEPAGSATVTATIDPEGRQTTYRVEYGPEVTGESATSSQVMAAEGFMPETVHVRITGLQPDTSYHFHVVAENSAGIAESADQTFATLPAVAIDSESVSQVSSDSARLETTLNPLTLLTHYHFEYGKTNAYGTSVPVPDTSVGEGRDDVRSSVLIEGLEPSTTYHFRVVAMNSFGEEVGVDRSLVTQAASPTSALGVIDGRSWELVSPPDKRGAALEAITVEGGIIQASEDGAALAYIAKEPVDPEPAGNRSFAEQQLLATRERSGVWSTSDIATPHEGVAGLQAGELSEYREFSPDLSSAILEPTGSTPLASWSTERTPYLRQSSGEFQPMATGCPPEGESCAADVEEHADVPPGTKFGTLEEAGRLRVGTGLVFRYATPDFRHALMTAPQSLVSGFETGGNEAVYEWSAPGRFEPVSVLPGGTSASLEGPTSGGLRNKVMRNVLSADGSKAFFEAGQHLYYRDMARSESVELDEPEAGVKPGGGVPRFQFASTDGTKAFFLDTANLTAGATGSSESESLYLCDLSGSVDERSCAAKHGLKDLTTTAGGESPGVRGVMLGASEDGSYAYFVAGGVLTNNGVPVPGAVNSSCREGSETCNLYVWHDGVVGFVALLSAEDALEWESQNSEGLASVTARVSPDGRYLAFMSQRPLTGAENRDIVSGVRDEEVYLYDAVAGSVVCASCNPTGARPIGVLEPFFGLERTRLVDRVGSWRNHWVAASIPGWTPATSEFAPYQSRALSDDGRLFFNSSDGLVPGDANGQEDVYEFEPAHVGGCEAGVSSSMSLYVGQGQGGTVDGCVGLISSGNSSEESVFLDASGRGPGGEEGGDVFFLTAARLATADSDNALDVYDAHVCGAASPCDSSTTLASPPECASGELCRSISPPSDAGGPPASATIVGNGNVKETGTPVARKPLTRAQKLSKALHACREKRNRRKRQVCEGKARRLYSPPKANKRGKKR